MSYKSLCVVITDLGDLRNQIFFRTGFAPSAPSCCCTLASSRTCSGAKVGGQLWKESCDSLCSGGHSRLTETRLLFLCFFDIILSPLPLPLPLSLASFFLLLSPQRLPLRGRGWTFLARSSFVFRLGSPFVLRLARCLVTEASAVIEGLNIAAVDAWPRLILARLGVEHCLQARQGQCRVLTNLDRVRVRVRVRG